VVSAKAQIFVQPVRFNHFARIHLPIRVPNRFELAECLDQFWSEHFGEKLCARLPVAMLARERTSITDDEVCCLFHELAELRDALAALHVIAHATMHTTVAEVAVEHPAISE